MLAAFIIVILGMQRQHDSLPTSPLFPHPLHRGVMCTQARFSVRRRRCGLVGSWKEPSNLTSVVFGSVALLVLSVSLISDGSMADRSCKQAV